MNIFHDIDWILSHDNLKLGPVRIISEGGGGGGGFKYIFNFKGHWFISI